MFPDRYLELMEVQFYDKATMFLNINRHIPSSLAAVDDSGGSITYGELCDFSGKFYTAIGKRTLIFILSENAIGAMAGYVAALSAGIVPLILSRNTDLQLLKSLIERYKPEYLWAPEDKKGDFEFPVAFKAYNYLLMQTRLITWKLNKQLSMLLPTSGSTGSPKLVRHSYDNVEHNARNVASFFELDHHQRPIAILPMHYTMGLSVVSSHLYTGATLLLIKANLTEKRFWDFIRHHKATSFTGVPFSFEILHKLRFFRMELPDLTLLTQGGGKLSPALFKDFAEYAQQNNKKFIATYGQTEGTARMAWLPPELALEKICSIGMAIPNGELSLIDENGETLSDPEATGQMVYKGPNVTLGYANRGEDLALGDENKGVLFTGDIAKRDADGCYFILGRMKRFLKLYGHRISLDETEHLLKSAFGIDCVCTGDDKQMKIITTSEGLKQSIIDYLSEKTGLFHQAFEVETIEEIPKSEVGKKIY
jgi:long-chain acyl-CoA synthetase